MGSGSNDAGISLKPPVPPSGEPPPSPSPAPIPSPSVFARYDLGFIQFRDTHNVGILVGVWLSVAFVYFIDLQVRVVLRSGTRQDQGAPCVFGGRPFVLIPLPFVGIINVFYVGVY